MRQPRVELGSPRWQREILTTKLPAHGNIRFEMFKKIVGVVECRYVWISILELNKLHPKLIF